MRISLAIVPRLVTSKAGDGTPHSAVHAPGHAAFLSVGGV